MLEGSTYDTATGDGRTIVTQDFDELDKFFNDPIPAPEFDYHWGAWH